jgi:hypothetical protein
VPVPSMSRAEAMDLWEKGRSFSPEERDHVEVFFDRVLLRKDQVLVYAHHETADVKMTSYGSNNALLPRRKFSSHPKVLPDTPGESNYAYELVGIVES